MAAGWISCTLQELMSTGKECGNMDCVQQPQAAPACQAGPYLRTQEGQESAILCNNDEGEAATTQRSAAGPDFEVVSAPETAGDSESRMGDTVHEEASTSRTPETQVVYTRDGVAVWPTRKQRIIGRLSLIKQNSVLFFAWLPYSQGMLDAETSTEPLKDAADVASIPVSQGQYAVHPVPLSELKAMRKQTPKLGNHHIVLVLKNGLTLPPFYFSSGGVRALFSSLKQHAVLSKSNDDPSTYLINDVEDPLQRSLATLDLSDALMLDPAQLPALKGTQAKGERDGDASIHSAFMERMREGMHRATQFARDSTSSFLSPPRQAHAGEALERRKSEDKAETSVGLFEMVHRSESDSMASGLEQPCPPPLTQDEWFTFLDSSGRIVDGKALRVRIFYAGVEPSIRKEAWKFLLGMYPAGSTAAYRQALLQKRSAEYELVKAQWTSITDKQAARFGKWRERRARVNKDVRRTDCGHPFYSGEDNPNVATLRRILLTYSMYNFDLGYCQGMSDLVSPLLFVLRDEALTFWCFVSLMERMEANFNTDCTGMHAQLEGLRSLVQLVDPQLYAFLDARECLNFFFCYRWLLVHFKREFAFEESLRLWESLWSCTMTPHFHIYMCAAVLRMHRTAIMAADMSFDELLSFCIQLSGKLDLGRTMRCAEKLFKAAGEAGVQRLKETDLP